MDRSKIAGVLFASSLTVMTSTFAWSQDQSKPREVAGSVRDSDDKPLNKAVVQLENHDTQSVETHITDADGSFHFKRLLPNTDYEIWATYQQQSSKKVFLSKFSDKPSTSLRLVVNIH